MSDPLLERRSTAVRPFDNPSHDIRSVNMTAIEKTHAIGRETKLDNVFYTDWAMHKGGGS